MGTGGLTSKMAFLRTELPVRDPYPFPSFPLTLFLYIYTEQVNLTLSFLLSIISLNIIPPLLYRLVLGILCRASLVAQLVKNPPAMQETACNAGDLGLIPVVRKIPWRRNWQPIPVFSPGKSHGQRSLPGYSPWGPKELDTS